MKSKKNPWIGVFFSVLPHLGGFLSFRAKQGFRIFKREQRPLLNLIYQGLEYLQIFENIYSVIYSKKSFIITSLYRHWKSKNSYIFWFYQFGNYSILLDILNISYSFHAMHLASVYFFFHSWIFQGLFFSNILHFSRYLFPQISRIIPANFPVHFS